jgi:hypothetical protein
MIRTASRRLIAAALTVALATAATACSGDDEPPASTSSSAAPSEPPPLETTAKLGKISGRLGKVVGRRTLTEVTALVDGWIDAAYLGGDYPRKGFRDAFPGFTPGATREARRDVKLLSNADIGQRIDAATAKVRRVVVDVLGVRGAPRGATARVRLVFVTEGSLQRRVTVTGRLALTPGAQGWQIFAYDVAKGSK